MSKYQKKVLNGLQTESQDWVEYLKTAHKLAPGMTPKAFDNPKTIDSKNSYQVLVEAVRNRKPDSIRMLDLACGDGHLIKYLHEAFGDDTKIVGVDMSERELLVAKTRYQSSNVLFKHESADAISEPDQSFDLVLCHMAFMLMNPIEPVLLEISRVLKLDGVFAGIVGGGPAKDGFFLTYRRILNEFMKSNYPDYTSPVMGDLRTLSADGLNSLFGPPYFKPATISDFEIIVKVSPEGAAQFFEDMYSVSLLPSTDREILKTDLISNAKKDQSFKNGEISFSFPMRLFVVTKA